MSKRQLHVTFTEKEKWALWDARVSSRDMSRTFDELRTSCDETQIKRFRKTQKYLNDEFKKIKKAMRLINRCK